MDESKRRKNETQFKNWLETETGGRIYWFEVQGKWGWKAKHIKEVDEEENTLAFRQEIYDDKGVLREIHEKYPIDKGHTKLNRYANKQANRRKKIICLSPTSFVAGSVGGLG